MWSKICQIPISSKHGILKTIHNKFSNSNKNNRNKVIHTIMTSNNHNYNHNYNCYYNFSSNPRPNNDCIHSRQILKSDFGRNYYEFQ